MTSDREPNIYHFFEHREFFVIAHSFVEDDIRALEREIVDAFHMTDIEDYGIGVWFNQREDAEQVAVALGKTLGRHFAVYSSKR